MSIRRAWVTSRWILAQAMQSLRNESRVKARRALKIAIEVRGGEEGLPGVDALDAKCKVLDHDWVHRQVFLYSSVVSTTSSVGAPHRPGVPC